MTITMDAPPAGGITAMDQESQDQIRVIAERILLMRRAEQKRFERIERYNRGRHESVYVPHGARQEYRWLHKRSIVNYLPLIVSVIAQQLHVDGYRPTPTAPVSDDITAYLAETSAKLAQVDPDDEGAHEQQKGIVAEAASRIQQAAAAAGSAGADQGPWQGWMANKLASEQHGLYRSIVKYGVAYAVVLPGEPHANVRFVSPRRITALYEDDVYSEWPDYAIEEYTRNAPEGRRRIVRLYDSENVYTLMGRADSNTLYWPEEDDPFLPSGAPVIGAHNMGVCPVVRYQYEIDLDGEQDVQGEIEGLIPLQDQVNTTTFNILMAQQYAAFRQRWVSGMVPDDENGRPREPFRAGVDRLFVAEDATTKFGEFGQTDISQYLDSREASIRHMSTIAQVPPYHLLGQIANLSAEALAAARDGLDRKTEEIQGVMSEPHKQMFQLICIAEGDDEGASDYSGEVIWRDTGARTFAATVDALGKLSQMLGVPATELWSMVPGVTEDQVARWRKAITPDVLVNLDKMLAAATSGGQMAQAPGGQVSPEEPFATDVLRPKGL